MPIIVEMPAGLRIPGEHSVVRPTLVSLVEDSSGYMMAGDICMLELLQQFTCEGSLKTENNFFLLLSRHRLCDKIDSLIDWAVYC